MPLVILFTLIAQLAQIARKKLQYTPTSNGGDRIYPWL